jgi:mannose-6-phosphate isomerase-like protein (cupin superfamily)
MELLHPFYGNISDITEQNTYFRQVIATTPNMQLVVMSLQPGEDIGLEVHQYITQFIRIERGRGVAIIDDNIYELHNGDVVIVPLGSRHNIVNTSFSEPLKLYTVYSPPNHPLDRIDLTKPTNAD